MNSSVLTMTALRLVLATLGLVYILVTNPESLLLGPLGHFIKNFLPGSTPLNLLLPGLTSEMVCDVLLVVAVIRDLVLCLLPWLMLNIMLTIGLGTGILALIWNINLDTNLEPADAINQVRALLLVILLLLCLVLAIIHLQAVIQVGQDIKVKRARSYDVAAPENVVAMNVTEDHPDAESLIRKDVYIPNEAPGQPLHDSSFDSYDEVP